MIEFAGICSDEKYVVIEHYPKRIIPQRKYITQTVPGRSGDLYIEEAEDAFANYNQPYGVFLDAITPGLPQVSRGLAEWLLGNPGYQRLEDSYDPDFYRMAIYTGGEEFLNYFNEYGRGTLTFNCAPKRYYKIGEQPISLTYGAKIHSPSIFKCHPYFIVGTKGTSASKVNFRIYITDPDGTVHTFYMVNVYGTIRIDSEAHTAIGSANFNANINSQYEDLFLVQDATITWDTASINYITLIPRWWTI